jgi:hypothetical protein
MMLLAPDGEPRRLVVGAGARGLNDVVVSRAAVGGMIHAARVPRLRPSWRPTAATA